jgi:hypothetical protein
MAFLGPKDSCLVRMGLRHPVVLFGDSRSRRSFLLLARFALALGRLDHWRTDCKAVSWAYCTFRV